MKKTLLLLLLLLIWLPVKGTAEGWTPETLPMVHLQNRLQYLCNPDSVISPSTTSFVDATLRELEDSTGVQTVVVVVKHIEGDDPYTFGMELSKKYGIGLKSQNSGLIIILATEDRSYQILTGEGLEATLPDAICSRIERKIMVPYLKSSQWDNAISKTVTAISQYVRGDHSLTPENVDDGDEKVGWGTVIFLLIIFGLFIFVCMVSERRDCPRCKSHKSMQKQNTYFVNANGRRVMYVIWKCKKCGHIERQEQNPPDDTNGTSHRRGLGPLIFTTGLFGNSSGGGFGGISGGSFGGGSFGGGGAGGRF